METERHLLLALAALLVLGVGAQWLAWRLKIPSILLLLVVGFIAGPTTGLIDPKALFGNVLFPLVSLSVAIILFEGGLSLQLKELRETRGVVVRLLTVGVLITWALTAVAARIFLDFPWSVALLLGAILVVTGPTVIGPMLRNMRPTGGVGPVARWEGIVVDPLGAVMAVLVFEAVESIGAATAKTAAINVSLGLLRTVLVGGAIGAAAAGLLVLAMRRRWIPDFLQSAVVLMIVLAGFTASNLLQQESGLLTVTLMGIIVANQKTVPVRHIAEFKENLSVLLLACLFILLAARLRLDDVAALGLGGLALLAAVVLLARPAAVLCSTVGSSLCWKERALLAWFAPRGIVAAAVSSLFALRLTTHGDELQSATFLVIVGTVLIYGLTTPRLARRLGLSSADPQGMLIAGAHAGARAIAHALQDEKIAVCLVDSNRENVRTARMEGLPARAASILSERIDDELDLGGIGRFLGMTRNSEVNSLAALRFQELFGRSEVYQLRPQSNRGARSETASRLLHGRLLFAPHVTYETLDDWFALGATVRRTSLTEQFDFAAFQAHYGDAALPLFALSESGKLTPITGEKPSSAVPNAKLFCLVKPDAPVLDG
ncbi:MAG: sodium:proton antiporter [Pirellulales bacterium]|nr:sodium:proton antiporter [Pirellulales bacterium]